MYTPLHQRLGTIYWVTINVVHWCLWGVGVGGGGQNPKTIPKIPSLLYDYDVSSDESTCMANLHYDQQSDISPGSFPTQLSINGQPLAAWVALAMVMSMALARIRCLEAN